MSSVVNTTSTGASTCITITQIRQRICKVANGAPKANPMEAEMRPLRKRLAIIVGGLPMRSANQPPMSFETALSPMISAADVEATWRALSRVSAPSSPKTQPER